jgi:hypothetical protein
MPSIYEWDVFSGYWWSVITPTTGRISQQMSHKLAILLPYEPGQIPVSIPGNPTRNPLLIPSLQDLHSEQNKDRRHWWSVITPTTGNYELNKDDWGFITHYAEHL